MTKKRHPITVGELQNQLNGYDPETEIYFGGLDFYRVKSRGPKNVQIEFNQLVYLDEKGLVVIENLYQDDEPDQQ